MRAISYKRHRFPPDMIRHAVWLYFRFTLSLRDVEELLAQSGIEVSYETIRRWTPKFGRLFAHNLRRSRPKPTERRNKAAALKLMRKLLKNHGVHPETMVTDKLTSCRAAAGDLSLVDRHRPDGMRENNRAENSHLRSGGGSESSRSSSPRPRPKGFSPLTPPSTTSSISSLI